MSTDLEQRFDAAGRTPPPSRLDPDTVLVAARRARRRRRLATGTGAVAGLVVAALGVAALVGGVPRSGSGPVAPSPASSGPAPSVRTFAWYSIDDPARRRSLTAVSVHNVGSTAVTVGLPGVQPDASGAVAVDARVVGPLPADPSRTTLSLALLDRFGEPVRSVVVPAGQDFLVVLRVRPSSCPVDVYPEPLVTVPLRSASGVDGSLVLQPTDPAAATGWMATALRAACGTAP